MKFLCHTCGNSRETRRVKQAPASDKCDICGDKYVVSDTSQLLKIPQYTPPQPEIHHNKHIFCKHDNKVFFFFHSNLEKYIFFSVTLIGTIVLTAVIVSKALTFLHH